MAKLQGTNVPNANRDDPTVNDVVDALFGIRMTPATTPLAGTETLYVIQDGEMRKVAVSDLGGGGGGSPSSESVTTGSDPINADVTKTVTRITSGGTAGNEHIVLPDFAATTPVGNEFDAPEKNGTTHIFIYDVQTNDFDVVNVFVSSDGNSPFVADQSGAVIAEPDSNGVVLSNAGSSATFVWRDSRWYLDNSSSNNSTTYAFQLVPAPTDSPNFTGTPTAPTAEPGTNTTQIANTAFVDAAIVAAGVPFGQKVGAVSTDQFPYVIKIVDHYGYVWHDGGITNRMEIFNITYPTPRLIGVVPADANMTGGDGFCISGNYLYAANRGTLNVCVIDITDKFSPSIVATITTEATPQSVVVSDDGLYLIVANLDGNSIQVFDVTDPTNPVTKSTTTFANPVNILTAGTLLYVFNYVAPNNLTIYDFTDPTSLVLKGSCSVGAAAPFLGGFLSGNYLYAPSLNDKVRIFDVSTPTAPTLAASLDAGSSLINMALNQDGTILYTLHSNGQVKKWDFGTPPALPTALGSASLLGSSTTGIAVAGGFVFITDHVSPDGYVGVLSA